MTVRCQTTQNTVTVGAAGSQKAPREKEIKQFTCENVINKINNLE
jgi:hypothetical protein